jgi:3-hydroxyisobutyrate dehydrogenase-like beta-hydroxyacid dehydrogenase
VIVSVCPPVAAVHVADAVLATGFTGTYVDANAIAPGTARSIGTGFSRFVDGGIVGPPVGPGAPTHLYLAGTAASAVAARFVSPQLEIRVLEGGVGAASAVKMSYAAWTKGSAALLVAIRALARAEGIDAELMEEWSVSLPGLQLRSEGTAEYLAAKAWRFSGEMDELARTFSGARLPGGFGEAAAEIYGRLADLKGRPHPTLADVTDLLLAGASADAAGSGP